MSSIFSRIIAGEIPSYKVYEDELTYAFLDIYPVQPGHILVVPKVETDRLEDLPEETYVAVMATTQMLMQHVRQVLEVKRACLKVEGFDIPHAHMHIIPCNEAKDFYNHPDRTIEPDHQVLAVMAEKLIIS